MKFKTIGLFIFFVFVFISSRLSAQVTSLDEYKAEIGIDGGSSYYLGDANSKLFNNMHFSYGAFFRYIINPRFALRAEFNRTNNVIKPSPDPKNQLNSSDICAEFNFFDFEKNPYKQFSKTFSPYIFLGLGMMTDVYLGQTAPEISCPFGLGMKVKLAPRWNLNIQWSNKLLLPIFKHKGKYYDDNGVVLQTDGIKIYHADDMEDNLPNFGLNDPYALNGSNIFNNDLLSTLTVGISFDIWKKNCNCENYSTIKDHHKYKKKSN